MTAKQVQIRRDSATNINAATPADGELGYDTTNDELRIGDGATAGGLHIPNSKMIQAQSYLAGTAGGSADAITLTLSPVPAAYVTNSRYVVKLTATNATTTPTLNVNGLGAKTIKKKSASGAAAVAIGDLQNGCIYSFHYDGTNMQVESVDQGSAGGGGNVQTFTGSGTWSKPASGTMAFVMGWGGGGSGAAEATSGACAGGGGGGYKEAWIPLSSMGSTETVTIGAGGAAVSGDTNGNIGGNTTLGSLFTAYGGGGGATGDGGGSGGGWTSAGTTGSGTSGTPGGGMYPDGSGGGIAGVTSTAAGSSVHGGGGGGAGVTGTAGAGGHSVYGGGGAGGAGTSGTSSGTSGSSTYGGGGGGSTNGTTADGAAGTSVYGGNGGASGVNGGNGTAGSVPGGGGGASEGGTSGAGGAGKLIVIVV